MGILDNFESAWDQEFNFESSSKYLQKFSETCCNGCSCQTSEDHKKEATTYQQDI